MAFDPVSLAITAVLMAAQMAMQASQKIEGPRLDSLDVTIADYGTQIPRFWGRKRLEGVPIIHAERLREKKTTSKTKGGKYTEYKYYGTFAVLIADHEIDSVSRIWLDKHLCYDLTKIGPISVALGLAFGVTGTAPVKLASGVNMRIYTGTETQEPDPRIEAWCEDRYGADSCPAYRGSSYIVFEEIPLEKFGNRLPQVTVEAINQPTVEYLYEEKTSNGLLQYAQLSPARSRMFIKDVTGAGFKIWDIPTRTVIVDDDLAGGHAGGTVGYGTDAIYSLESSTGTEVWRHSVDGLAGAIVATSPRASYKVDVIEGRAYLRAVAGSGTGALSVEGATVVEIETGFRAACHVSDGNNDWAIGTEGTTVHFYCMYGPRKGEAHSLASPTASTADTSAMHNGDGGFTCTQGGSAFIVADETFTVTDTATWSIGEAANAMANINQGAVSIFVKTSGSTIGEFSTVTLDHLRDIDLDDWVPAADADSALYDPINHAVWTETTTGARPVTIYYIDRAGSDGVQLQDVVDDVCDWCGLTGADTTALTQTVRGYSVTQGSGKDMIEPLLDVHDVDPCPHDFSVKFVNRGSSPGAAILTENFVREGDAARYEVAIAQDTDLPRRMTLNFADPNADQQTNTVITQRPLDAMDSARELSIDMTTYVVEPDEAQQYADRYFRRLWNGRETVKMGLTAKYLGLEPGDVRTISLDGVTRTARLAKMTLKGSTVDCEFVRDDPSLATLGTGAGAEMDGRDDDAIFFPLPTKGFFLDAPLIRDTDSGSNPVIYLGAGPYAPGGWSGAGAYQGDGTDYDTLFATVDSASKTSWGRATDVLATANANLWDRGNAVNVRMNTGTLTSSTEAAINADETLNLAFLGSELIQFATATLEADGSYTLSTLKRGRRGTDWAVTTHAIGDELVLCEHLSAETLGASDIGDTLYFKAASIGRSIDEATPITIVYAGESHKPYAPAHVRAVKNSGSGDWVITWRRRSRIGWRWTGLTTVPLGESAENYKVEILDAPGGSVVRTITAASETATYTAAQQVTDGGAVAIGDLDLRVRQIGDLVDGRNTALAA